MSLFVFVALVRTRPSTLSFFCSAIIASVVPQTTLNYLKATLPMSKTLSFLTTFPKCLPCLRDRANLHTILKANAKGHTTRNLSSAFCTSSKTLLSEFNRLALIRR